jgi:hypothetical protein
MTNLTPKFMRGFRPTTPMVVTWIINFLLGQISCPTPISLRKLGKWLPGRQNLVRKRSSQRRFHLGVVFLRIGSCFYKTLVVSPCGRRPSRPLKQDTGRDLIKFALNTLHDSPSIFHPGFFSPLLSYIISLIKALFSTPSIGVKSASWTGVLQQQVLGACKFSHHMVHHSTLSKTMHNARAWMWICGSGLW